MKAKKAAQAAKKAAKQIGEQMHKKLGEHNADAQSQPKVTTAQERGPTVPSR